MQASARHAQKAELDSECFCFDEFPQRPSELAAKQKLPGNLQDAEKLFVAGFQFCEEVFLQLKCNVLVGGQASVYSFRNARNREDAAQRLQRFVRWEVSFQETFHCRFALLALNVQGLCHRTRPYQFSPD
jgi:hypothetical protein